MVSRARFGREMTAPTPVATSVPSSHSDCPAKQTLVEDPAPEQRKPPLPCGQASASPAESGLLDAEIVGGNLPEVPSPAFSFSDREWMNYQQQRQRLEEADVVEAALVQHGRKLARQKPLCGTTKWGRCPMHFRARWPHLFRSGLRRGRICLVCQLWFSKDQTGRRPCWNMEPLLPGLFCQT